MFFVYLLKSQKDSKYYIGQTDNILERLKKHNSGKVQSTKTRIPFELMGYEKYPTRDDARCREFSLKRSAWQRRGFIEKLIVTVVFVFLIAPFVAVASSGNTTGYAWSTKAGWINFGCDNCNVQVTSSAITGYLWSQDYGWINLAPDHGGVTNNAGVLSGSAWGQNTGWIDFSLAAINSQGQFTGSAIGDVVGDVVFTNCGADCGVQTDWRAIYCGDGTCNGSEACGTCPADCGVCSSGSGGGSALLTPQSPTPPAGGFSISINNNATITNNPVVTVTLNAGADTTQVELSTDPNFTGAVPEVYEQTKSFVLSAGDGTKTIYARFISKDNIASSTISSSITLDTTPPVITVNQPKISYTTTEDVIISGTVSKPSEVIIFWNNQYGLVNSDSNNNWQANLGKLPAGTQSISLMAKDQAGNTKTISTNLVATTPSPTTPITPINPTIPTTPVTPTPVTLQGIFSFIPPLLDKIKSLTQSLFYPSQGLPAPMLITIPKDVPLALQGIWNLLPMKKLNLTK